MFVPLTTVQKDRVRSDLDKNGTMLEFWKVVYVAHQSQFYVLQGKQLSVDCFNCFILLQGKDGFLGRCVISPMVRLEGHQTPEPRLQWYRIKRGDEEGGELLAACELFLVRPPLVVSKSSRGYCNNCLFSWNPGSQNLLNLRFLA